MINWFIKQLKQMMNRISEIGASFENRNSKLDDCDTRAVNVISDKLHDEPKSRKN